MDRKTVTPGLSPCYPNAPRVTSTLCQQNEYSVNQKMQHVHFPFNLIGTQKLWI